MKKFCIFLTIFVFCIANSVLADNPPSNIEIKNMVPDEYGIINTDTGKIIMPYKYYKIERIGEDFVKRAISKPARTWEVTTTDNRILLEHCNNVIVKKIDENKPQTLNNSIIYGYSDYYSDSMQIWVPDIYKQNLSEKILAKNNEIFALKFFNYPKSNLIIIKDKSKYGFIFQDQNVTSIIPPQFDKIYLPDIDSVIFRRLGISFSENKYIIAKKNNKWNLYNKNGERMNIKGDYDDIIIFNSEIFENCEFNENDIDFTYSKKKNLLSDRYIVIDKQSNTAEIIDTNYIRLAGIPGNLFLSKNFKSVLDRINDNNTNSFIKFKNFPSTGSIIITDSKGKKGLLLPDGSIIPTIYSEFCFADFNSLIYRILGITYDDTERIIAKKNNKWGIIDRNNKIIVDFIYDNADVMPLRTSVNVTEQIDTKDKDYKKRMKNSYIDINFEKIDSSKNDFIFVSKGDLAGVIDKNGNVIVPFKQIESKSKFYENMPINGNTLSNWDKAMSNMSKVVNKQQNIDSVKATIHDYAVLPYFILFRLSILLLTL